MVADFFPFHVAVQIVMLNLMTALAFVAVLAPRYGAAARAAPGNGAPAGRGSTTLAKAGPRLLLLLAAWYVLVFVLTRAGWIRVAGGAFPGLPTLPLAIIVPVAIGLALLASRRFTAVLDAVPVQGFAGFHVLRIFFGFVFLSLYEMDAIPAVFAFRGGYGDILAGVLGGATAYLYARNHPRGIARTALLVWSGVGLLDFVLVLYTGLSILKAGDPFQEFYPFLLIPAYVVPMFILTHIYALRALLRGKA